MLILLFDDEAESETKDEKIVKTEDSVVKKIIPEPSVKKVVKVVEKKIVEKKSAIS